MELPWTKNRKLKQRINHLESELETAENELEKMRKKLEAEQDRRSRLSRQKQDAEEKVNRLEDKVNTLKNRESGENLEQASEFESINVSILKNSLKKLGRIKGDNLVTVYSPEKLRDHSEITEIKNSLPKDLFSKVSGKEGLLLFYDEDLGFWCFKIRPFFSEKLGVGESFDVSEILDFVNSRKVWAQVSRGDSRIFEEDEEGVEELEKIRDRVDRKHGKGGFSQGRFERKRNEQIEQHLEKVGEKLKQFDEYYLLGDREVCKDFEGEYLGGFDPLKSARNNFYQVQRLKNSGDQA